MEFDVDRFYLGRLCKNGHDWNGTGQSLRRKNQRACIQCHIQHQRASYWKHREKNLEQNRNYYKEHRKEVLVRHAEYYQKHKEDWKRRQAGYVGTPQRRETIRKYMSKFRQTPQGRIALKRVNSRRKARKRHNHHAPYNIEQIHHLLQQFDHSCAYCGATDLLVLDHFIPISVGGPDCLGNFVPACHSCNNNKRNHDPILWYKSKSYYSPERLEQILKILNKTESNYNQLPLL